jgi:hypothetical protein
MAGADSSGASGTAENAGAAGAGQACGDATCKAGDVCVDHLDSNGNTMFSACVADPCAPDPLDCSCAKSRACLDELRETCESAENGRVECKQ